MGWVTPLGRGVDSVWGRLIRGDEASRQPISDPVSKKEYSALSVYISLIAQVETPFLVPKQSFFPVPAVDGALVCLKIKPESEINKTLTDIIHETSEN